MKLRASERTECAARQLHLRSTALRWPVWAIASRHPLMSPQAFAEYGCNAVGYVRQMRSEDAEQLYPQAPMLIPGSRSFVLHRPPTARRSASPTASRRRPATRRAAARAGARALRLVPSAQSLGAHASIARDQSAGSVAAAGSDARAYCDPSSPSFFTSVPHFSCSERR